MGDMVFVACSVCDVAGELDIGAGMLGDAELGWCPNCQEVESVIVARRPDEPALEPQPLLCSECERVLTPVREHRDWHHRMYGSPSDGVQAADPSEAVALAPCPACGATLGGELVIEEFIGFWD